MSQGPRAASPRPVPTRPQTIRTKARAAAAAAAGGRELLVRLRGLELMASIGVHPHEHDARQRILVDLTLDLGSVTPHEDRLAETVDYQAVAKAIEDMANAGHVQLVETLANRIADWCLRDARVRAVTISIEKPEALTNADAAGCTLTVSR